MKEQLVQIIEESIPEAASNLEEWQCVLDGCNTIPSIFHLSSSVKYYVAYFSKNSAINLSIVLFNNNQAVGVMPLMIHLDEPNNWTLTSNGVEIIEPIFIKNLARKVKKRLELQIYNLIYKLSDRLNIRYCQFANMEYGQLSSWYLMWANKANDIFPTHHLLVDLSLSIEDIRLKLRKSFQPLVNKSLHKWIISSHNCISTDEFDKFRLLHKSVSGRSTRTLDSWKVQKDQINSAEATLITVTDNCGDLIGGGLFTYSSYQGMYCVGAYNRELFSSPIGHGVQWKAIELLKEKGCLWYEIGQKHLMIDRTPPTKKELSISNFKEGFATNVIARQHVIVNMQ